MEGLQEDQQIKKIQKERIETLECEIAELQVSLESANRAKEQLHESVKSNILEWSEKYQNEKSRSELLLKKLADARAELQNARTEVKSISLEYSTLLDTLKGKLREECDKSACLSRDIIVATEDANNAMSRLQSINQAHSLTQEKLRQGQEEIRSLTEKARRAIEEATRSNELNVQWKIDNQQLQYRMASFQKEIKEKDVLYKSLWDELENVKEENLSMVKKCSAVEEKLLITDQKLQRSTAQHQQLEECLTLSSETKGSLEEKIQMTSDQNKALQTEIDQLNRTISHLETAARDSVDKRIDLEKMIDLKIKENDYLQIELSDTKEENMMAIDRIDLALKKVTEEKDRLQVINDSLEGQLSQMRENLKLEAITRNNIDLQILDLKDEISRKTNEIDIIKEKLSTKDAECCALLQIIEDERTLKVAAAKEFRGKVASLEEELSAANKSISVISCQYEAEGKELQEKMAADRREISQYIQSVRRLENTNFVLESHINTVSENHQEVVAGMRKSKEENAALEEEVRSLRMQLKKTNVAHAKLVEERDKEAKRFNRERNICLSDIEQLNNDKNALRQEIEDLKSQLEEMDLREAQQKEKRNNMRSELIDRIERDQTKIEMLLSDRTTAEKEHKIVVEQCKALIKELKEAKKANAHLQVKSEDTKANEATIGEYRRLLREHIAKIKELNDANKILVKIGSKHFQRTVSTGKGITEKSLNTEEGPRRFPKRHRSEKPCNGPTTVK